jgi:F0F1-type ATP synthase membrane subunit b/b'
MPKLFGRETPAPKSEGGSGEPEPAPREAPVDARSSKTAKKSSRSRPPAAEAPDGGASVDFAQVGEQVAMVLAAAKEAAETMRSEARAEAQRIRTTSQKEAREAFETAKAAAERADSEAASARADAEQQSKELREQADEYASATREAADAKAAALLAQAEKRASARELTFQERRRSLDEGVVRTEERLRQLVSGLHELAAGLEELVEPGDHSSNGNGDNWNDESFVGILTRSEGEPHSLSREGGTT